MVTKIAPFVDLLNKQSSLVEIRCYQKYMVLYPIDRANQWNPDTAVTVKIPTVQTAKSRLVGHRHSVRSAYILLTTDGVSTAVSAKLHSDAKDTTLRVDTCSTRAHEGKARNIVTFKCI